MNADFIQENTVLGEHPGDVEVSDVSDDVVIVEFDENGVVNDAATFIDTAEGERDRAIAVASRDADFIAGLGLKNGDDAAAISERIARALFGS